MPYTYFHPHPAVTVDAVVFGYEAGKLTVLLIQRKHAPHQGKWAIPGGFVESDENLDTAVRRELQEETGIRKVYLEQLYTFGEPKRDPRERVISVAYYALVKAGQHLAIAADDARAVRWFPAQDLPALAFDHASILDMAQKRLQAKIRYEPIGFELLPGKFPLSALQDLYETILGHPLDKRNFRKKILEMGLLELMPERQQGVAHRAASLYRFDSSAYLRLKKSGFNFDL